MDEIVDHRLLAADLPDRQLQNDVVGQGIEERPIVVRLSTLQRVPDPLHHGDDVRIRAISKARRSSVDGVEGLHEVGVVRGELGIVQCGYMT